MRKYSCSDPHVVTTRSAVEPNSFSTRTACFDSASIDRRSGVFLSSASPVQLTNAVGMTSVTEWPLLSSHGGLVGSHAVYPRASKVERMPPDGKLEASGSPLINSLPLNSATARPSAPGEMKASCFSAVIPVIGWNQWV